MQAAVKGRPDKSDVAAKEAFVARLEKEGYVARITRTPADITAVRDGVQYYFEIKKTERTQRYFGAATLTEWSAALKHEDHYRFVVARMINGEWDFRQYTPQEFMMFSSVPPFKIFFDVPVDDSGQPRSTRKKRKSRRVWLSRENIRQMVELYESLREGAMSE